MNDDAIEILMIEDSESDIRLTQIALKQAKLVNNLNIVSDGASAMSFLKKDAPYQDKPTPDLILLDLNLPKLSGYEVLKRIRMDESLNHIPVVILTTSEADEDVIACYKNNANCYISKPADFSKFMDVIKNIEHFWLKIVKLPHPAG